MKNLLLLTAALNLFGASALAGTQWGTDPMSNKLICSADAVGQDLPLAASTPDGSTYISWLSWEGGHACVKLQLVDKNGNFLLPDGGIYVSNHPTPTWSSGYDITTDADGNAIIVNSDKRNGVWQAYVYKVSPDGQMLWDDGIPVSDNEAESCLNPKVRITDRGNAIVAYQSLYDSNNTIKAAKLNSAGKKSWGANLNITGTNGLYSLVTSTGDSFYVARFDATRGNLDVMRYTPNGEDAWDAPVTVDKGSATISTEPLAVAGADGQILLGWRHTINNFTVNGQLQCIDRNGTSLWNSAESFSDIPSAIFDPDGNIYAASSESGLLSMRKYMPDGTEDWSRYAITSTAPYMLSIYGVHAYNQGFAAVYRCGYDYNMAEICMTHLDKNGNDIEIDETISNAVGDKGHGGFAIGEDNSLVVTWGDNQTTKGGGKIYAQDILLKKTASVQSALLQQEQLQVAYADGTLTIIGYGPESSPDEVSVHDLSGCLLYHGGGSASVSLSLPKGIYVVSADGQAAKLAVK